jgi:integrase/recombinase XerD
MQRFAIGTWEGRNLDQLIGCPATYLGHVKVTDTYWYLTGIPELLGIAAVRFERFARADSGGGS